MQVDTEGDLLTSVDFSSSGECLAFGGSGGFVHLWCYNQGPRVNLRSAPLDIPPAVPEPYLSLDEDDSFAAIPPYYPTEVQRAARQQQKPPLQTLPVPRLAQPGQAVTLLRATTLEVMD